MNRAPRMNSLTKAGGMPWDACQVRAPAVFLPRPAQLLPAVRVLVQYGLLPALRPAWMAPGPWLPAGACTPAGARYDERQVLTQASRTQNRVSGSRPNLATLRVRYRTLRVPYCTRTVGVSHGIADSQQAVVPTYRSRYRTVRVSPGTVSPYNYRTSTSTRPPNVQQYATKAPICPEMCPKSLNNGTGYEYCTQFGFGSFRVKLV